MTPLVIVCGPPAVGKTTLAKALSAQLGHPVISKDASKEAPMDHLGGSPAVGAAAFAAQFAIAHELLRAGVGIILEGALFVDQAELADLAELGDAVVLRLDCKLEILEKRYIDSQASRHPSHRGLEALPDLRQRVRTGSYDPPDLHRPVLRIDSSAGFNSSEAQVVRWLQAEFGAKAPEGASSQI
ncbi:MAG: AAA family ATPase [Candidatus Dormibacteraceae bacterium]